MQALQLPTYSFRIRTNGQSKEIFDSLRKKFVALTPEEWVRQHFLMFMISDLHYPMNFITVEKSLKLNNRIKRTDIVVHNKMGLPWIVVECKAPHINLSEEAFYQAAAYHLKLNVQYLIITNGMQHYCCKFAEGNFQFIDGFPEFET